MHRRGRKIRPTVQTLLSLALLAGAPAVGQEPFLAIDPRETEVTSPGAGYTAQEFGVQDAVVTSVGWWDLQCLEDFELADGNGYISGCDVGLGGLQLPSGASVIRIELEACDHDTNATTQLAVGSVGPTPTDVDELAFVQTGFAEAPGCAWFGADVDPPATVNNDGKSYFVSVANARFFDTTFRSVQVIWRRQVSPAPSTATFDDVPTSHLFFQQIEALVDSGITAGCGGGDFCPNAPLTRGQMAAFLATALGLHWGDISQD